MAIQHSCLEEKKALVFGGTSGLGKAIAIGLAEAGAQLAPVSRRLEAVRRTAAEIRTLGGDALEITADVTVRTEVQRAVDIMLDQMGRIDVLVNSAGITKRIPSLDVTDETWDQILDVNINGTWNTCQIVGRVMRKQGYGRIVNIASLASFVSVHEATPYCASKGAVAQITRCLAAEWAKYGITVNAIAPGVFETPLNRNIINDPTRKESILSRTPMGRYGNVDEIKGPAVFLASDSASFITGEILTVDGGFMAQGIAK
jgi:NAD(P)-dependent dehydrogenase (short-subunit alcohol dehydrogenase family)